MQKTSGLNYCRAGRHWSARHEFRDDNTSDGVAYSCRKCDALTARGISPRTGGAHKNTKYSKYLDADEIFADRAAAFELAVSFCLARPGQYRIIDSDGKPSAVRV